MKVCAQSGRSVETPARIWLWSRTGNTTEVHDLIDNLRRRRCRNLGHRWFPKREARELIPVRVTCLCCKETSVALPYGTCLTKHPVTDHYDAEGHAIMFSGCGGPR